MVQSIELSSDELKRYGRHLIMPEIGLIGQKKLKNAKVLIIGCGGLGSPIALYLAAAGIGTIGLIDFDKIDFSNLQRQILFNTSDVGREKVEVAAERLKAMNSNIEVKTFNEPLNSENALEIFKNFDIIIDGTDNFPTRYLSNDACVLLNKPNVYASIFRFEGQITVFDSGKGPCYRCLYPEPPPPGEVPSCAEGGVLGILPGILGIMQANEAIKLILGIGTPLIGKLLCYNALSSEFTELKLRKNPDCPICGKKPTISKLIDYNQFCGIPSIEDSIHDAAEFEISPVELKKKLDFGEKISLIDVREPHELEICKIGNAKNLPLSDFNSKINQLDSSENIVLFCHHGVRSMKALEILKNSGFKKIKSLKGGIDSWAEKIDKKMNRY